MSMKDWIKGKKTSDTQYYIHIPSRKKDFYDKKSLSITKLSENRGYVVFISTGEDYQAIQKEFNTEKEALSFANKFMKEN